LYAQFQKETLVYFRIKFRNEGERGSSRRSMRIRISVEPRYLHGPSLVVPDLLVREAMNERYGIITKTLIIIRRSAQDGIPSACSVRAFNLHGINRVSGRARNANTRYIYALGPRIPSSDRREKDSCAFASCRIVWPRLIYDLINKSAPFRFPPSVLLFSRFPPCLPCCVPRFVMLLARAHL